MEVIAVGYLKALNIEDINRLDHGMYRVLVAEILIELAIAALVVMGTGPKIYAPFHVMQTRTLCGRKLSQAIFPEKNFPAPARRDFALLPQLPVFSGHASQGPVKSTAFTVIIDFTRLAADNTGLHPDAGRAV